MNFYVNYRYNKFLEPGVTNINSALHNMDISLNDQALSKSPHFFSGKLGLVLLLGLALSGLYLSSLYSYLLFHSLTELFSIIIGCTIFILAACRRR